jgi:hypothetical protein
MGAFALLKFPMTNFQFPINFSRLGGTPSMAVAMYQ